MKIALIQPTIPDGNYLPSLGLLYIASVLEKNGFDVKIFDGNYRSGYIQDALLFRPDLVGLTAVTAAINSSFRIAKAFKMNSKAKIVLGGAHPSALPDETVSNPSVDYVIVGEGEYPMVRLSQALQNGERLKDIECIENLYYKVGGVVRKNEKSHYLTSGELDQLPYPAFHLLDLEFVFKNATHGLFSKGKRILPIMTSRGCPQVCTFCCRMMGYKSRERSVASVINEIEYLAKKFDIDELYIEDDNFTHNKKRAISILDGITALDIGIFIKFANGLRADRELLLKIKEAGGYWIGFGIESGSKKVLHQMKKKLDLDIVRTNVRIAKSLGFYVGGNCIIGYPGETKKDLKQSLKYFHDLKLDSSAIVTLIPFPKTFVHSICKKNGYLTRKAENYDNYYFKIFNPSVLVSTPYLSEKDIIKVVKLFYLRFYLHPVRIYRTLKYFIKKVFLPVFT